MDDSVEESFTLTKSELKVLTYLLGSGKDLDGNLYITDREAYIKYKFKDAHDDFNLTEESWHKLLALLKTFGGTFY